jgi:hypothetical protein
MKTGFRFVLAALLLGSLLSFGCSSGTCDDPAPGADALADSADTVPLDTTPEDSADQLVLTVRPALAVVPAAGQPVTFSAASVPEGASLAWVLSPEVGTLVPGPEGSATYTPPAAVDLETTVTITATAGDQEAQATVVVTPYSQLAIDPATAELLEGGDPLPLVATLEDSDAPVSWTLSPTLGLLSAATGLEVTYTPPTTVEAPTLVLVRATAGSAAATTAILVRPRPEVPELTVSPSFLTLEAGSAPAVLIATLANANLPISWSIEPDLGTLSATEGVAVTYTPPASVEALTPVVVTVTAGDLEAEVTIEVEVSSLTHPSLIVTPEAPETTSGGGPVLLSAEVQNSQGTVLWSLSPTVGTLSGVSGPTVSYIPPATLDEVTTVTVFALLDDLRRQVVITVHPAPTLSVDPATTSVTAGSAPVPLTATLLHSSDPVTWSLSPEVGQLSVGEGLTTDFAPPASVTIPVTVLVTASAAGLSAQATIVIQPAAGADAPPLLNKRFVPFTRIAEFLVLGTSSDGSANDQFVLDPYKVYGQIDDQPISLPFGTTIPDHALLHRSLSNDMVGGITKVARAGNLDNDFPEEVVVLSWKPQVAGQAVPPGVQSVAKLTILDASLASPTADPTITPVVPLGIDLLVESGKDATDYDLAVADLDGDGYDEIVVLGTVYWDPAGGNSRHKGKLWVFDDLAHGCTAQACPPLHTLELEGDLDNSLAWRGLGVARLAVGSMTDDRKVQIVVAWIDQPALLAAWTSNAGDGNRYGVGTVSYAIYDGATLDQIGGNRKTASIQTALNDGFYNPHLFAVALADVDQDLKKELVVAAWNSQRLTNFMAGSATTSAPAMQILDDLDAATPVTGELVSLAKATRPYETIDGITYRNYSSGQISSYPRDFVLPIDFDGDLVDELLVASYPCHFIPASGPTPASIAWVDSVMALDKATYHNMADIRAGDINGDRRQDFIVLEHEGRIRTWGLRDKLLSVGGYPLVKTYQANPEFRLLDTTGTNGTYQASAILVPVNVDGDSTMLEYAGFSASVPKSKGGKAPQGPFAHAIIYGNNKLVAVLAAPPVLEGAGQSEGNNTTTFGTSTGGTYSTSLDVAARVGVIIGGEADFFGVFSASVEAEFMLEYTHNNTWSRTETHSLTYSASDDDAQVVFATTPYDRYVYNIASSPTPANNGAFLVVDVPRTSLVLSVGREVYNEEFSDGLLITEEILGSTAYDLDSYPTSNQLPGSQWVDVGNDTKLLSKVQSFGYDGPWTVSQGTAPVNAQITIENEEAWSNGVSFSVDVTASMTMGGTKVGGKVGFSVGGSWEQTTSNGLAFGGTIYGIPDYDVWAASNYQWGLFAYKQQLCTHEPAFGAGVVQDFFVVNYWIQPK